jgi:hypothetical protein
LANKRFVNNFVFVLLFERKIKVQLQKNTQLEPWGVSMDFKGHFQKKFQHIISYL